MTDPHRAVITGPGAWTGAEIQHDESWIHRLSAEAVEEIDAALARAKRMGLGAPRRHSREDRDPSGRPYAAQR